MATTLDSLITEGEAIKNTCVQQGMAGEFVTGQEYATWIAKSTRFLEINHNDSILTKQFIEASKNAVGNDINHYYLMFGILQGFKDNEPEKPKVDLVEMYNKRKQESEKQE